MATNPVSYITQEQYLEMEREAEYRSEYWNGEMFAKAGGTLRHNLIVNAIARALYPLRNRCRTFTTGLRLLIPATGLHPYPDVMVVCGEVV